MMTTTDPRWCTHCLAHHVVISMVTSCNEKATRNDN